MSLFRCGVLMKIYNFFITHARVKNAKDFLILLLKLAIILFLLGEIHDGLLRLFCLAKYYRDGLYFYIAKLVVLTIIFYFLYRITKYFKETESFRAAIIIFIILSVFTSWFNGSILGIYFWDGPYWGRVVDADTGKPISGANVMGKWKFKAFAFLIVQNEYADGRETITNENGWFFLPIAREVWLWPLSSIYLDELNVYKPGYDSHRPRMQYAWTDKDKQKWRDKLIRTNPNYDHNSTPEWNYNHMFIVFRKNIKAYKPTIIKLNKARSIEEQRKAAAIDMPGIRCEYFKIKNMKDMYDKERERLY
jgi:hypothetical protein